VIDGNVIHNTARRKGTNGGHGIAVANSFDYIIVNNVASENDRWGIVASGGVGLSPEETMSQYFVVQNNICRANTDGGITIDPSTRDEGDPTDVIHNSFATVAANVCVGNHGRGIQTIHAGYVAVHGNICDSNDSIAGRRQQRRDRSYLIAVRGGRRQHTDRKTATASPSTVIPGCRRAHLNQTWATTCLAATCTTGTGQTIPSRSPLPIRRSGSCTINGQKTTPVA
jgi:hypothetical protein